MDNDTVISVQHVSKQYKLGTIKRRNLSDDISYHLRRLFGKNPDTLSKVDRTTTKGEFWALNDISFDIKRGDAVALIGKNGAGKSTMLKILSRITMPTSGRVELRGRIVTMLEVGTGFHPEFTGRENIYMNGAVLGMSRKEIDAKFDEIVDFSGVEKFLDTPVKRYSSGMYVRLAFSVASHLDPEILLIDEILAVGDAQFRAKCLDRMKQVSKSGTTIVFVSHNMQYVLSLCNKAVLFDSGRLKMFASAKEVADEYKKDINLS